MTRFSCILTPDLGEFVKKISKYVHSELLQANGDAGSRPPLARAVHLTLGVAVLARYEIFLVNFKKPENCLDPSYLHRDPNEVVLVEVDFNHPSEAVLAQVAITSVFSLMGGIQLFGMIKMLGLQQQDLGRHQNEWAWFGYQVSMRVLEVESDHI